MSRFTRILLALAGLLFIAGCAGSEPASRLPAGVTPNAAATEPTQPAQPSNPTEATEPTEATPTVAPTTESDAEVTPDTSPAMPPASPAPVTPAPAPSNSVAEPAHNPDAAAAPAADSPLLPREEWPSFDCAVALTPVESFLCTRSQAAQTDRLFAEFWAGYLAERTDHLLLHEHIELQQAWLENDYREACLDQEINQFQQQDCIRQVYLERENALTHARLTRQPAGNEWSLGWGSFSGTVAFAEGSEVADAQPAIDALADLAQADLQLAFQSNRRVAHSSGSVDITITSSHGQRLSAFGWSKAGFIRPSAHPYFSFREFLYDREEGAFIHLSDLLHEEHHTDAASVLVDAMIDVADRGGSFDYLRSLSLDELAFAPVFDDDGLIVGFQNYALAESLGSYAGRLCFYGLTVPAARLVEYVNDEYADLFSPDRADSGTLLPNCE